MAQSLIEIIFHPCLRHNLYFFYSTTVPPIAVSFLVADNYFISLQYSFSLWVHTVYVLSNIGVG